MRIFITLIYAEKFSAFIRIFNPCDSALFGFYSGDKFGLNLGSLFGSHLGNIFGKNSSKLFGFNSVNKFGFNSSNHTINLKQILFLSSLPIR
jgi:hypothetical protein